MKPTSVDEQYWTVVWLICRAAANSCDRICYVRFPGWWRQGCSTRVAAQKSRESHWKKRKKRPTHARCFSFVFGRLSRKTSNFSPRKLSLWGEQKPLLYHKYGIVDAKWMGLKEGGGQGVSEGETCLQPRGGDTAVICDRSVLPRDCSTLNRYRHTVCVLPPRSNVVVCSLYNIVMCIDSHVRLQNWVHHLYSREEHGTRLCVGQSPSIYCVGAFIHVDISSCVWLVLNSAYPTSTCIKNSRYWRLEALWHAPLDFLWSFPSHSPEPVAPNRTHGCLDWFSTQDTVQLRTTTVFSSRWQQRQCKAMPTLSACAQVPS